MASSSSYSSLSSIDFSTAILIRVDQSGKGDFNKIQEAIESIPPNLNNSQLYFIWVKPGVYRYTITTFSLYITPFAKVTYSRFFTRFNKTH